MISGIFALLAVAVFNGENDRVRWTVLDANRVRSRVPWHRRTPPVFLYTYPACIPCMSMQVHVAVAYFKVQVLTPELEEAYSHIKCVLL